MSDAALVAQLQQVPSWVSALVVHPDTMSDVSAYEPLGRRLVIENMDARKDLGQTADDLRPFFYALPLARFCFDVAHAKAVDPTMEVGNELLTTFATRLSHIHISSLDGQDGHVPLTRIDEDLFADLLRRCADVPWILEAPPS